MDHTGKIPKHLGNLKSVSLYSRNSANLSSLPYAGHPILILSFVAC